MLSSFCIYGLLLTAPTYGSYHNWWPPTAAPTAQPTAAPTRAPTALPTPPRTGIPTFPPDQWQSITCPVISMLFRNGDLVPDSHGNVSKSQTFDALLRVGISAFVARMTTDDNFDHLPGDQVINIFKMNTVSEDLYGRVDPPGALEHFRSTGVRDDIMTSSRFDFMERMCASSGSYPGYDHHDIDCIASLWDKEVATIQDKEVGDIKTNDVLEDKRHPGCGPGDSGPELCPSQLHGSLHFMHQEFGSPSGIRAFVPKQDYRNMWLAADYPPDFLARSPRECVDVKAEHHGCQACLDDVQGGSRADDDDCDDNCLAAQRYCRCMLSTRLEQAELDNLFAYRTLGCPTGHEAENMRCHRLQRSGCADSMSDQGEGDAPIAKQSCEPFCAATGDFMAGCCKIVDVNAYEQNPVYYYGSCNPGDGFQLYDKYNRDYTPAPAPAPTEKSTRSRKRSRKVKRKRSQTKNSKRKRSKRPKKSRKDKKDKKDKKSKLKLRR